MDLKKLIVPTLCVLLGCAGGAAMGTTVIAQTWPEPANVQRWQQECVQVPGINTRSGEVARYTLLNEELRRRGDAGWENFHVSAGLSGACFKRPAP